MVAVYLVVMHMQVNNYNSHDRIDKVISADVFLSITETEKPPSSSPTNSSPPSPSEAQVPPNS